MLLAAAIVLAQTCSGGVTCSEVGFQSKAGLFGGSGTPDFTCGDGVQLEDGGISGGNTYCYFESLKNPEYTGNHADFTFGARWWRDPDSMGIGLVNRYFGPLSTPFVWSVRNGGDTVQWGSVWVSQNGGGLRNGSSYAAIYGHSLSPNIPDVVAGTLSPYFHYDKQGAFGVYTGFEYPLVVQGDGFVRINEVPIQVRIKGEGLQFVVQMPDGGTQTAIAGWE